MRPQRARRSENDSSRCSSRPERAKGFAAGSLHMLQGQAIDFRLADVPRAKLRHAALAVRRGGVGCYPASDFVRVDTGRVRAW